MTETELKKAIVDYLVLMGAVVLRINSGGQGEEYTDRRGQTRRRWFDFVHWFAVGISHEAGRAGVSDLVAFIPAEPVAVTLVIETKVGRNKPTAAQERFLAACRVRGVPVVVAYTVEEVRAVVEKISQRRGSG